MWVTTKACLAHRRRIKSGMALFGKCFHIHAKDNIPPLEQKFQLPVLQNKFNKFISFFGKLFLVTLETWIKFTVFFLQHAILKQ